MVLLSVILYFFYSSRAISDFRTDLLSISKDIVLSVVEKGLSHPSVIAFDSLGNMLVTSATAGTVTAIDSKGVQKIILQDLKKPYGIGFYTENKQEYLFIAESNSVKYYTYNATTFVVGKGQEANALPDDGINPEKSLLIAPKLRSKDLVNNADIGNKGNQFVYIGAGSACQACTESTWKHAAILESDLPGAYLAQFASGLRNVLAMTINPLNHTMWAIDTNRTDVKNSQYSDEVNQVEFTQNYGWPGCAGNQQDTVFTPLPPPSDRAGHKSTLCDGTILPKILLPPNSYPTGLTFIPVGGTNNPWPKEWQGNLIVALHGRDKNQNGYQIVRYVLDSKGDKLQSEDLVAGWLIPGTISSRVLGTPRDVKIGPDMAVYISDDTNGSIYRIAPSNSK